MKDAPPLFPKTQPRRQRPKRRIKSKRQRPVIEANPFHRQQRGAVNEKENFPNLDTFLFGRDQHAETQSRASSIHLDQSTCSQDGSMLNMSIGALAALNEHNRYIEKFGIDGEHANTLSRDESEKDMSDEKTVNASNRSLTGLDEQWNNLLELEDLVNKSSGDERSPSFLIESSQDHPELSLLVDQSSQEQSIEVMTDVSQDYFNSSRVKMLATPERYRGSRQDHVSARGSHSFADEEEELFDSSAENADSSGFDSTAHSIVMNFNHGDSTPFDIDDDQSAPLEAEEESKNTSLPLFAGAVDLSHISAADSLPFESCPSPDGSFLGLSSGPFPPVVPEGSPFLPSPSDDVPSPSDDFEMKRTAQHTRTKRPFAMGSSSGKSWSSTSREQRQRVDISSSSSASFSPPRFFDRSKQKPRFSSEDVSRAQVAAKVARRPTDDEVASDEDCAASSPISSVIESLPFDFLQAFESCTCELDLPHSPISQGGSTATHPQTTPSFLATRPADEPLDSDVNNQSNDTESTTDSSHSTIFNRSHDDSQLRSETAVPSKDTTQGVSRKMRRSSLPTSKNGNKADSKNKPSPSDNPSSSSENGASKTLPSSTATLFQAAFQRLPRQLRSIARRKFNPPPVNVQSESRPILSRATPVGETFFSTPKKREKRSFPSMNDDSGCISIDDALRAVENFPLVDSFESDDHFFFPSNGSNGATLCQGASRRCHASGPVKKSRKVPIEIHHQKATVDRSGLPISRQRRPVVHDDASVYKQIDLTLETIYSSCGSIVMKSSASLCSGCNGEGSLRANSAHFPDELHGVSPIARSDAHSTIHTSPDPKDTSPTSKRRKTPDSIVDREVDSSGFSRSQCSVSTADGRKRFRTVVPRRVFINSSPSQFPEEPDSFSTDLTATEDISSCQRSLFHSFEEAIGPLD